MGRLQFVQCLTAVDTCTGKRRSRADSWATFKLSACHFCNQVHVLTNTHAQVFLLEVGDCQQSCSGTKAPQFHIRKRQQKLQPAFQAQFQPFKIYFTDPQSPAAGQREAKWSGAADIDGNCLLCHKPRRHSGRRFQSSAVFECGARRSCCLNICLCLVQTNSPHNVCCAHVTLWQTLSLVLCIQP